MPAPVLVVHDEQDIRELAVSALRAAFLEVLGFDDPIAALNAIETDSKATTAERPRRSLTRAVLWRLSRR
jgi:DNA-binding NtrC family response regulator